MKISRSMLAIALLIALGACSRHSNEPPGSAAGSDNSPGTARYDSEKILNVYSWADYIAPDTVPNFERETGIKVRYDTYDNNEVLETKLLTGHTNYDVVLPTGNFFEHQLRAGVYRALDKAALPNLVNADPEILRWMAVHDPGNLHAVPYMWTTTGLGYNIDKVRARLGANPPDGWGLLFDPANAAKLQDCGIAIVDSPGDVFASAIIFLGRDPNSGYIADVAAASEVLRKIRPYIRYIDPAQHTADLATGNICLSLAWAGDVGQARGRAAEAKTGMNLAYLVPREGAIITVDTLGIPADAPHPRNAHLWLDYLMRPDVIAGITNAIKYPNGNQAALPLVQAAIRNDEAIYPSRETRARLIPIKALSAEYSRVMTREWTRFRTGY